MKKILFIVAVGALGMLQVTQTGCTDMNGDGIDSLAWGGSTNPEATSFRNPVWEPSLTGGTVVVTPTNYVAIGAETQWAKGVDYCCPTLYSSNMMQWSFNQQMAFTSANRPKWVSGQISSLSVDYITETTKVTITTDSTSTVEDRTASRFFMLYDGGNAIGVASASSAQGPYIDHGCLVKASDLGMSSLSDPFIVAYDKDEVYMGYTTNDGSYVAKVTFPFTINATTYAMSIDGAGLPTMDTPVKVAPATFSNIALFRDNDGKYFIFGDVNGSVNYAVASEPTGPYAGLASGNGESFIEAANGFENPCNVMRVVLSSNGKYYVAYNATLSQEPTMASGYARQPMMLNPFTISNGKITSSIETNAGWTSPRF